jgi:hypothetical protein
MPITTDSFAPAYVPSTTKRTKIVIPSSDVNALIESINAALVSVGWASTPIAAHGTVFMPFFFGDERLPLILDGVKFLNPFYPGSWTFGALAGEVNSTSPYYCSAAIIGGYQNLVITAKTPGTAGNQPRIWTPIGIGNFDFVDPPVPDPQSCAFGGYHLESQVPVLPYQNTSFSVDVVEDNFGQLLFSFHVSGANPQFTLRAGPVDGFNFLPKEPIYTFICNPYQFCLIDEANLIDNVAFEEWGGNSILASALAVDFGVMPFLTESQIIVGPGVLKNNLGWNGTTMSVTINGRTGIIGGTRFLASAGVSSAIFPYTESLQFSSGLPLAMNAYVLASLDKTTPVESSILGKLWDSMVITQAGYNVGAEFEADGHQWHLVSQNEPGISPQASLWIAFGPGTEP